MLLAFHMSRSSIKGGSPWAQGELSAKLTEGNQMLHGLEHLKNAMYNPQAFKPAPLYSKGSLGAPEPAHHGKLRFMRSCFAYCDSSSVSS